MKRIFISKQAAMIKCMENVVKDFQPDHAGTSAVLTDGLSQ
jgi:hypothetical protein